MSVFSSVMSAVSSAIPTGNKILQTYNVDKNSTVDHVEVRWRLFPATHPDRKDMPLTVFLFEKKNVDRYPKTNKDAILETLKNEASILQRLRHPSMLHMQEVSCQFRC